MLTKEELIARRDKIGGSDAAAICGVDPHKTAYHVALRIRGDIQSDELEGLDHIEFGNEMEGVLARFYERKEKVRLYTPKQIVHPDHPFIAVNIDRMIEGRDDIGIECKNVGLHVAEEWGEPGTDEVPMRVLLQCQHAMMIAPAIQMFHVLRCYGGNTYQKFILPRSQEVIDNLFALETEFMASLRAGVLPDPDWGHKSTKDTIKRAFRKVQGTIEHMPQLDQLTQAWQEAAAERLRYEKLEKALKNEIEHKMGNNEVAVLSDGRRWRRREVNRRAYEVAESKYIECRLLKS